MNKRGLSDIITVVLIILIVLAAIVLLWNVVQKFILKGAGGMNTAKLDVALSTGGINFLENPLKVPVTRSAGQGDISSIKITLTNSSGDSCIYENSSIAPRQLETVTYYVFEVNDTTPAGQANCNIVNATSYDVYPVFADNSIGLAAAHNTPASTTGGGGYPGHYPGPSGQPGPSGCTDGSTQSCGSSVGECNSGIQNCSGGIWGACVGVVGPSTEICDGKDNNCNGQIDEGGVCITALFCDGMDINRDGLVNESDRSIILDAVDNSNYTINIIPPRANIKRYLPDINCSANNAWCFRYDLNKDGKVNQTDLDIFNSKFPGYNGMTGCTGVENDWCGWADMNHDGIVDGLDYGAWQNAYMQPCYYFFPGICSGDANWDGIVDGLDYGAWQNNYYNAQFPGQQCNGGTY
jgi:hypothetical protein